MLLTQLDVDTHLVSGLVQGDYKLIRRELPREKAGLQLFDLARDPRETRDILVTRGELASSLERELDRLETGFASGIYVELVNGASLSARHHVEGTVEVLGGEFDTWELTDVEDGDQLEMDAARTRLRVSVELLNRENPIRQNPPVFVDRERVRFTLSPPAAEFRVALVVDGRPAGHELYVLGNGETPEPENLPFRASGTDAALLAPSYRVLQAATGSEEELRCRVYAVKEGASTAVEIDEELDARLRALGYTGN